ncbi:MAG: ATP-binding protein [Deltaproteobacteria bacterium]|nr:ATP-binding protein [Deltaproteobacteria bacterium]
MYIKRILTDKLFKLTESFPVVVISGARQVGKSTLLQNTLGKTAEIVVFDPVIDIENARQDPELFLNNHPTPLILDEIQYAPELLASIKRRIDKNRSPGQYILTGSQQWGVMKSMSESLAGRAVFLDLEGFCLLEINENYSKRPWIARWLDSPDTFPDQSQSRLTQKITIYEQLWRGFLPEPQFLPTEVIPDFLTAYQRTYIERDVRLLAEVSDLQLFSRFLRLVSALTAQEINYSQLGRELGLTPQTARRWLDILKATFQWFEIPAYSGNLLKRVSNKPKGFIADTGLACLTQAISTPKTIGGHPLWGALFETAVAAELRKQINFLSPRPNIYHWRAYSGAEVDIILEYNGVLYPIEIKSKTNPSRRDTMGISAFRKRHLRLSIARGLVIAPCSGVLQLSEHDYAVPWDLI